MHVVSRFSPEICPFLSDIARLSTTTGWTATRQIVVFQRDSSSGALSSPTTTKLGSGAQPVSGVINGLVYSGTTGKLLVLMTPDGSYGDSAGYGGGFVVLDVICAAPTPSPTDAPTPAPLTPGRFCAPFFYRLLIRKVGLGASRYTLAPSMYERDYYSESRDVSHVCRWQLRRMATNPGPRTAE